MCGICGDLGYVRSDAEIGSPDFGRLVPCECQARALAERYQKLVGYALKPARFTDLDTRNRPGTAHMVAAARQFAEGWLTIWGTNGTGKSVALRAIACECLENGRAALYAPLQVLVDWLKVGIEHPDFPTAARADILASVPVLLADELTGAHWSDWVATQVETILDRRYSAGLATVLAMDEDPEGRLHPRLLSRIRESVVIHNADADYRAAIGAAKERMVE